MINQLPTELFLRIITKFHLTSLIASRGVCRRWRDFLSIARIRPVRQALLEIYLQIIDDPWFIESRPWVLDNLTILNREAYVQALLHQHVCLPEAFEIWLMEWPANAVFGGIWPGLPDEINDYVGPLGDRKRGWNYLEWESPVVRTVNCIHDTGLYPRRNEVLVEPMPAIPIWYEHRGCAIWIRLHTGRYGGQVLKTIKFDEFAMSDVGDEFVGIWANWVDFLRSEVESLRQFHEWSETIDWGKAAKDNRLDKKQSSPWTPDQMSYPRPYVVPLP